jgi:tripartite-type tricarboxylate transporter receptor subunit TctC
MIELGYSNFLSDTFHAVLVPNGTPPEIIQRVATVLLETLREPALHEQLRSQGFEVIGNGPDSLRRRIELEVQSYRDLIVKVGIEPV